MSGQNVSSAKDVSPPSASEIDIDANVHWKNISCRRPQYPVQMFLDKIRMSFRCHPASFWVSISVLSNSRWTHWIGRYYNNISWLCSSSRRDICLVVIGEDRLLRSHILWVLIRFILPKMKYWLRTPMNENEAGMAISKKTFPKSK